MKFKVGDRVRVKCGVGSKFMKNCEGVVTSVKSDILCVKFDDYIGGHDGDVLCTNVGYGKHWWVGHSDCKLSKPETIVIYKHNDTVVAKNTATDEKAIAKCHPDDEFDFNTGAAIAFDRLLGKEIKEEYYNGKVVCVNANGMSSTTTGRIYEIVDGQFEDDGGNLRPSCDPVKSVEELNIYTLGTFIEVVE